jgi:hypothetical protein
VVDYLANSYISTKFTYSSILLTSYLNFPTVLFINQLTLITNMDLSSSHTPNRRSFPNLQHMSLAPLSSRFPIDEDGIDDEVTHEEIYTPSYIQGKSAPSTPGILSNSSKTRTKTKKSKYAYDSYFPPAGSTLGNPMTKAKSVGAISAQLGRDMPETDGQQSPLLSRHASRPVVTNDDEWYHRAGVVIASEMRESKGQSWLTSRDSSTSLVQQKDEYEVSYHRRVESLEITSAYQSRQGSRAGSRAGSRVNSTRPSRRGSRTGSRVEFLTSVDDMKAEHVEGYLEEEFGVEPDFVENEDEEGNAADAEIKRLSSVHGFGMGGMIDRVVGLSLFNVDEDSEDEDKLKAEETEEEQLKRRQIALRRRREELAKAASSSANATLPKVVVEPPKPIANDDEGGWGDVAWLLSVASKVIL